MTKYTPYCDCLGGHITMIEDKDGEWCRADSAAQKPVGCGYPCGYDCNGACFDQPDSQQEEVTVADHEAIPIGNIWNYYGGLNLKREGGQDFWCIEDWDGMNWEPCEPAVAAALRAMKGEQ